MRIIFVIIFNLFVQSAFCQVDNQNFDFEDGTSSSKMPKKWMHLEKVSNYIYDLDSVVKHSGKFSLRIQGDSENLDHSFGNAAYKIDNIHNRKKVELRGYMKFSDIKGRVGLYVRINNKDTVLKIESMMKSPVLKGNKDWARYSVSVSLNDEATAIYVGATILGTGKLWIDDFRVLVDGKELDDDIAVHNDRD